MHSLTLIALPFGKCGKERVDRIVGIIKDRWINDHVLYAQVSGSHTIDGYSIAVTFEKDEELSISRIKEISDKFGVIKRVIFLRDENDSNPPLSWIAELSNSIDFYRDMFEGFGGLRKVGHLTEDIYEHKRAHMFNIASDGFADGFVYFPYGYIYRNLGYAGSDELGFRLPKGYRNLSQRGEEHKLIAFFGGSACYDIFATIGERFSDKLEALLNSHDSKYKFTVLNFGTPGNILLNELTSYMLYAEFLRPDIVIAHDGFNDLMYGQCSDPYLLKEHAITYQSSLEEWAYRLGGKDYKQPQYFKAKNAASVAVQAYLDRKVQFQRVVNALGAIFISSLQPTIWSKQESSADEARCLKSYSQEVWRELFGHVPFLYQKLKQKIKEGSYFKYHVDLDEDFRAYGKRETYFLDTCHTLPDGNSAIADAYYKYIKNIF